MEQITKKIISLILDWHEWTE